MTDENATLQARNESLQIEISRLHCLVREAYAEGRHEGRAGKPFRRSRAVASLHTPGKLYAEIDAIMERVAESEGAA